MKTNMHFNKNIFIQQLNTTLLYVLIIDIKGTLRTETNNKNFKTER